MRALREQPRVVAATAASALVLVAVGMLLGALVFSDSNDVSQAREAELVQVRAAAVRLQRRTSTELQQVRADLRAAQTRLRLSERSENRLRRQLRAARRALAAAETGP